MITPLVSHPRSSRLFCQLTLLFLATSSSVFAQGIPPLDAYYKFDNSYDATPAAFTTNLTAEGSGQSFQPGGIIGTGPNCLTLSGSGSAYAGDDAAFKSDGKNITVSCWVNLSNNVTQIPNAVLVMKGDTGAFNIMYGLRLNAATTGFEFVRSRGNPPSATDTRAGPTVSLTPGTWYHVVGVYCRNYNTNASVNYTANNKEQCFVNGIGSGVSTRSQDLDTNTSPYTVGSQSDGAGGFVNRIIGNVDDVSVWHGVLSFQKIATLYALGYFEGLASNAAQIDAFVAAFTAGPGNSIMINGHKWQYTQSLGSTTIGTTGGTAGTDAYVVLDGAQNGMKITADTAPTLTIVTNLPGATEDTPFTITYETLMAASDAADVNGDPLSFRIEQVVSGTLTKNSVAVVPGSTLLGGGEELVWTPAPNAFGPAVTAFKVTAYDGTLTSTPPVPVTVTVTNLNDAPSLIYGLQANKTESFDTDVSTAAHGWTGYNNDIFPNVFGWSDTSYAGGNAGEAGGVFNRTSGAGWYADIDLNGSQDLNNWISASGRLVMTNNNSANNNWYLGHFNTNIFFGLVANFVGFQFAENNSTTIRVYAMVKLADGSSQASAPSVITFANIAYFDYAYNPTGDGQLVAQLLDASSNVIYTATLNLVGGSKGTGAQLNAFGASEAALTLTTARISMFWDDATYTRLQALPQPEAVAYAANDPATVIAPTSLLVSDMDNANLASATVQITGNYQSGQDVLGYTQIGNIAGSWNSGSGTMTLSGSDLVANYQTALQSVTYRTTSGTPSMLTRTVSFKVNDGALDSNILTRDIAIQPAGYNRLSSPSFIGAGTSVMSYLGNAGSNYALDWATNLVAPIDWIALQTNTATGDGTLSFTNTLPGPENFFRARLVP